VSRPALERDHIVLAAALSWRDEDGVPVVDTKRPLGSSGRERTALDVAEALGWDVPEGDVGRDDDEGPPDELVDRAHGILEEVAKLMPEILALALVGWDAREGSP
jgi:hypothetical protein